MLVDKIRKDMMIALKNGEKEKKVILSMLVGALDLKAKEKKSALTEAEEFGVVAKEIKQTQEMLDSAPVNRTDIIDSCKERIAIVSAYLPVQMSEEDIKKTISDILSELNINSPTKADKGKIMKVLMPQVKGKADGKLVNSILESYLN